MCPNLEVKTMNDQVSQILTFDSDKIFTWKGGLWVKL